MKQSLIETKILAGKILESASPLPKGVLCRVQYPVCHVDALNENGRKYSSEVWERVHSDARIQEKLQNRILWGHGEHPEGSQSNTLDVSHIVSESYLGEDSGAPCLIQTMDVLDTPAGRIVNTLLEAGCRLGVSTRAEGELKECIDESSGGRYMSVLPESFEYHATDFTADPSNTRALPLDRRVAMAESIKQGIMEKKVTKGFALSMLRNLSCDESQSLLDSIDETKDCECNPETICAGCDKCKERKESTNESVGDVEMDAKINKAAASIAATEKNVGKAAALLMKKYKDMSRANAVTYMRAALKKVDETQVSEPTITVGSSMSESGSPISTAAALVLEDKQEVDGRDARRSEMDESKLIESKDSAVSEFIQKYGLASGGNWSAMLMSALKRGAPEVFAQLDDARSYEFIELLKMVEDVVGSDSAVNESSTRARSSFSNTDTALSIYNEYRKENTKSEPIRQLENGGFLDAETGEELSDTQLLALANGILSDLDDSDYQNLVKQGAVRGAETNESIEDGVETAESEEEGEELSQEIANRMMNEVAEEEVPATEEDLADADAQLDEAKKDAAAPKMIECRYLGATKRQLVERVWMKGIELPIESFMESDSEVDDAAVAEAATVSVAVLKKFLDANRQDIDVSSAGILEGAIDKLAAVADGKGGADAFDAALDALHDFCDAADVQLKITPAAKDAANESFAVGDKIAVTMNDDKADPKQLSGKVTKQSADGSFEVEDDDGQKMTIDPQSRSYNIAKNMSENIGPIVDGPENDPSYDETPNDPSYEEDMKAGDIGLSAVGGALPDIDIPLPEGKIPDAKDKEDTKIKKLTETEEEILRCIDECIVDRTDTLNEDFNDAVNFLTSYFGRATEDQKRKMTTLFESSKNTNVKLSEARQLMIKEAEVRAERDMAIELAEHLSAKCGKSVKSMDELQEKLTEALGRATVNETEVATVRSQIVEATRAAKKIRRKYAALEEQIEAKLASATRRIQEEVTKQFIAQYVKSKFDNVGVPLPTTSRALLETCKTFEEVDAVSSTIMRSLRENALHLIPDARNVKSFSQLQVDAEAAGLQNVIGSILENMRT